MRNHSSPCIIPLSMFDESPQIEPRPAPFGVGRLAAAFATTKDFSRSSQARLASPAFRPHFLAQPR
jgi:hypothetical protein